MTLRCEGDPKERQEKKAVAGVKGTVPAYNLVFRDSIRIDSPSG